MASREQQIALMCQDAVAAAAKKLGDRAAAKLTEHRADGHAQIVTKHLNAIDWQVALDDPAWLSIEFGRGAFNNGKHDVGPMQPLRILRGALEEEAIT